MITTAGQLEELRRAIADERAANVALRARTAEANEAFYVYTRGIRDPELRQASRDADLRATAAAGDLGEAQRRTDAAMKAVSA